MSALDIADLQQSLAPVQTDHFQITETEWRARIESPDVELGSLIAVLWQALEAGMPDDAQVSILPGDDVVRVSVKSRSLVTIGQATS